MNRSADSDSSEPDPICNAVDDGDVNERAFDDRTETEPVVDTEFPAETRVVFEDGAEIEDDAVVSDEAMVEEHSDNVAMGFDDLELAYREALKSIDEAEQQVGSALMELAEPDSDDDGAESGAYHSIGDELAEDLVDGDTEVTSTDLLPDRDERITPSSVIEGALFVGGDVSLTSRRLASLIGQDTDARIAVRLIDQLNEKYLAENRPYEIQLHEGGFQLQLREEFAEIQTRVFGLGPREVKLSPEVLELLAFVAYNQPVTQADLADISHSKANSHLRQLVRLKLVDVERTGSKRTDVQYVTGQRFLKLFGLTSLNDLPQADLFSFK